MVRLCEMDCKACRGGEAPLKGADLVALGREVPYWDVVDEHHLSRTFRFADFAGALGFVNRVGALADQQGHHPDISLGWGKATVEIRTHKVDGLTESDFVLAAKIDALPAE